MRTGVERLNDVLLQATLHEVEAGTRAYSAYQDLTAKIAKKHGFSPSVGAAVFAALSPNNSYHGNLADVDTLLSAHALGFTLDAFKVHTYGNNKRKAWAIAGGKDPLELIVASKMRSFFLNINDPDDHRPVTVDGHMYNAWRGKRANLVGLRVPWDRTIKVGDDRVKLSLYEIIASDIRALAWREGMIPCQMQAILWTTWRRIHNIKSTAQGEFWDPDHLAAKLGYVYID